MKLPYFEDQFSAFEGYPIPSSNQMPLIEFLLGEDIDIELPLFANGEPIVPEKWNFEVVMKSSPHSTERLWVGVHNNGLYYKANNPGLYRILIPSSVTAKFSPGTFWLDLVAKEQIGASNDIKDKTKVLKVIQFSLDYSASSAKTDGDSPPAFNITLI